MSHKKVTNRAVLLYLERVYGVDIKALKGRIAHITKEGRKKGACGVKADGVRYSIGASGKVVSVRGVSGPMSSRGMRWKRRRK